MWQALQKPGILAKVPKLEDNKHTEYGQISWILEFFTYY